MCTTHTSAHTRTRAPLSRPTCVRAPRACESIFFHARARRTSGLWVSAKDVAALVERRASSHGRRWEGRQTASGAVSLVAGGVQRHRVGPQVPAFS